MIFTNTANAKIPTEKSTLCCTNSWKDNLEDLEASTELLNGSGVEYAFSKQGRRETSVVDVGCDMMQKRLGVWVREKWKGTKTEVDASESEGKRRKAGKG